MSSRPCFVADPEIPRRPKFTLRMLCDARAAHWLTLGAVWLAMIILANPTGEFPLNDDWVYALAVKSILATGEFRLPSPVTANVFAQIWWGALFCLPFGFSFMALRISTIVLGLLGVFALYESLREVSGSSRLALAGALVLACDPIYFGLACSFMTDVPFMALAMIGLFLMLRGLRQRQPVLIVCGVLILFADVLVRQLAVVVLLGFAVGYLVRTGITRGNLLRAAAPVVLGTMLHFVYQHWLVVSGRAPFLFSPTSALALDSPSKALAEVWWRIQTTAPYVGLFVFPILMLIRPIRQSGRGAVLANIACGLLFAGVIAFLVTCLRYGPLMPMRGNALLASGFGPLSVMLGPNMPVLSPFMKDFWIVVTVAAEIGAWCVACYVVYLMRDVLSRISKAGVPCDLWPLALIATTTIAYGAILLIIDTLYDRYILLMLPLTLLLLAVGFGRIIAVQPRYGFALAVVITAGYATFSVAAVHDYFAWNRARWTALTYLTDEMRIAPHRIDGGMEFNGWFLHDANYKAKPGKSWWWVDDDEFAVSFGPSPGYQVVREYKFSRWIPVSGDVIQITRRAPE